MFLFVLVADDTHRKNGFFLSVGPDVRQIFHICLEWTKISQADSVRFNKFGSNSRNFENDKIKLNHKFYRICHVWQKTDEISRLFRLHWINSIQILINFEHF